jgi:hypothetical protein
MSTPRHSRIRRLVTRLEDFSRFGIGIPLRPYQQEVANVILKSILGRLGLSFVVIFPRQSGKNETQAHIQAYLLCLLSGQEIEIISVSPTYIPQACNARRRLQRCLDRNPFTTFTLLSGCRLCRGLMHHARFLKEKSNCSSYCSSETMHRYGIAFLPAPSHG